MNVKQDNARRIIYQAGEDLQSGDAVVIGQDGKCYKVKGPTTVVNIPRETLDAPKDLEDMTEKELKAAAKRLDDKRSDLVHYLGELRRRLADLSCPYKVGDVLVNLRGERARIRSIGIGSAFEYGRHYSLQGVMLKKDGTDGKRRCHFYNYELWEKEVAIE